MGWGELVIQSFQKLLCESAHQAFAGGQLSARAMGTATMSSSNGRTIKECQSAPSFSTSARFHVLADEMALLVYGTAFSICRVLSQGP